MKIIEKRTLRGLYSLTEEAVNEWSEWQEIPEDVFKEEFKWFLAPSTLFDFLFDHVVCIDGFCAVTGNYTKTEYRWREE